MHDPYSHWNRRPGDKSGSAFEAFRRGPMTWRKLRLQAFACVAAFAFGAFFMAAIAAALPAA